MAGALYRRRAWEVDGFFVLRGWLDRGLMRELGEACDHALSQVRAASVVAGHATTHVSGFLLAEYFAGRPEALERLVEFVSSPAVLSLVGDLGRPLEGELELRDVQYFHEPTARDYDGAWHRDGDVPTPSANVAATKPGTQLRYRVAFATDDNLEYVPGSHVRADTEEELVLRRGTVRNAPLASGSERIVLEPGDVCVFDTWGVHRACYRHGKVRRTLDLLFAFGPPKRARAGFAELHKWLQRR